MKKILFTLLLSITAFVCNAQNGASQIQLTDNVTLNLSELQNKYNYMHCEYVLFRMKKDLTDFAQDMNIDSKSILNDAYHKLYDKELYNLYSIKYNQLIRLSNQYKEEYEAIKEYVNHTIAVSSFTDTQVNLIYSYLEGIDLYIDHIQLCLRTYKSALEFYQNNK